MNLAFHNRQGALGAVIDVHEAAGLMAVAPDFNLVFAGKLRFKHLAANGCGRLFASAGPGSKWSVDVVVPRNSALHPKVFFKVAAHPLAEKLLPSIAVFGQRWVGVCFLERNDMGVLLLFAVVNAG